MFRALNPEPAPRKPLYMQKWFIWCLPQVVWILVILFILTKG